MKYIQSTPPSKSKLLSLPFVLGLLLSTASASPIPNSNRLSRRDEQPQDCPGTLRGPSGNAYFAFSSNLNNQVAKEACASCYGGVLANVAVSDWQFLGANLEQSSWIRSWNGDDYSNSCLTLQPSGGLEPGVGVDSACASLNWPLCQATTDIPDGVARIEGDATTLISLALKYTPVVSMEALTEKPAMAPAAIALVSESETIKTTGEAAWTPKTGLTVSIGGNVGISTIETIIGTLATTENTVTQPLVDQTTVDTTPEAAPAPETVNQVTPVVATEQTPSVVPPVAEAPAPVTEIPVTEAPALVAEVPVPVAEVPAPAAEVPAPAAEVSAPVAEVLAPVAEESAPIVETPVPIVQSPPPAAEAVDPLMVDKERVRAAFEENLDACSAQLAYGEQDPVANEYMIEHMAETAECSEARHAAQAVRLAKEAAV
ncbi:hypothetical protein BGZ59_001996 [Podila verticillata]|nr:hypothetical protein BGZ59_001996 [Podila verticillata]KFH66655.1 hypothetical protein MVEG_07180 [Podila verticillata NRRL 6337]